MIYTIYARTFCCGCKGIYGLGCVCWKLSTFGLLYSKGQFLLVINNHEYTLASAIATSIPISLIAIAFAHSSLISSLPLGFRAFHVYYIIMELCIIIWCITRYPDFIPITFSLIQLRTSMHTSAFTSYIWGIHVTKIKFSYTLGCCCKGCAEK